MTAIANDGITDLFGHHSAKSALLSDFFGVFLGERRAPSRLANNQGGMAGAIHWLSACFGALCLLS